MLNAACFPLLDEEIRRDADHQVVDRMHGILHGLRMEILLAPELQKAIEAKIQSGLYQNASEVVSEALRAALTREQESKYMAREAAIGFAQLEAGQTVVVETKEQFLSMVRVGA